LIALDTNLLVYAHRTAAPQHTAAQRAIEAAVNDPRGCGLSVPCLAEFWSIVTHPSAPGGGAKPDRASEFINYLIQQGGIKLWLPGEGFGKLLLRAAVSHKVSGVRIFDLQIGLIAMEHGATEMWTHDKNFLAIRGLKVLDPLI
jgi:predicted nucleic acid-binding protein